MLGAGTTATADPEVLCSAETFFRGRHHSDITQITLRRGPEQPGAALKVALPGASSWAGDLLGLFHPQIQLPLHLNNELTVMLPTWRSCQVA